MFNINDFDVDKYDAVLARGLSNGVGEPQGQMCIEAAICYTLGLPHGDDPGCVAASVRDYKIALNDKSWTSAEARAKGLYKLGLAQLGSLGVVDDTEFTKRLAEKHIRIMIPKLFRELFSGNQKLLDVALRCEVEGTKEAANAASAAAYAANAAAYASNAAAYAANAAAASAYASNAAYAAVAANAAYAAANAAYAAAASAAAATDAYLILSADLALEVLIELESPGVALLK